MRTTLDIDSEVLQAAKELARQQGRTTGAVLSELARQGLRSVLGPSSPPERAVPASFFGFRPFSPRGTPVTNERIDRLRAESGG